MNGNKICYFAKACIPMTMWIHQKNLKNCSCHQLKRSTVVCTSRMQPKKTMCTRKTYGKRSYSTINGLFAVVNFFVITDTPPRTPASIMRCMSGSDISSNSTCVCHAVPGQTWQRVAVSWIQTIVFHALAAKAFEYISQEQDIPF